MTVVWLGVFIGPLAVISGFILVHELIFWSPFLLAGYLFLALMQGGGYALVLHQLDVSDFVEYPWEALPSLSSGWAWSGEKGREGNFIWYVK